MATKIVNSSLYKIIFDANRYHTPDVYINLVHISSEMKSEDKKTKAFIIQTGSDDKNSLVRVLKEHTGNNRQTISNCISEIQTLGLLEYSYEFEGWELLGMDKITSLLAVENDDELPKEEQIRPEGYTKLREFLLSYNFSKLKLREKKLLLYMCHLQDSVSGKKFRNFQPSDFVINIYKSSSIWRKILRTENKYYARDKVEEFLKNASEYIDDNSEEVRKTVYKPKNIIKYFFYATSSVIKAKFNIPIAMEIKYRKELQLINEAAYSYNVSLEDNQKLQIAHSIGALSNWNFKDYIVRLMMRKFLSIQKYNPNDKISSIPNYLAAVVKSSLPLFNKTLNESELEANINLV